MSKCISASGEFSEHEPSAHDFYTCDLCGVEDTDRMRESINRHVATLVRVYGVLDFMRDDHDRSLIGAALEERQ